MTSPETGRAQTTRVSNTGRPAIGWINGPQNVPGTSATIMSLAAHTRYQAQVLATSDEGDSPWSAPGAGQTGTAGSTAPECPSATADREVAENTAAGQNVGRRLTATDGDSDPLAYTLEGTDAAAFNLATISGSARVQTLAARDYETSDCCSVTVKADDGNGYPRQASEPRPGPALPNPRLGRAMPCGQREAGAPRAARGPSRQQPDLRPERELTPGMHRLRARARLRHEDRP